MQNLQTVQWVLRIAIAGEFFGHAMFALQGKAQWIGWVKDLIQVDTATATLLLALIGILDIIVALVILIKPIRAVLLWAALWGFWTALLRPLAGESFWDFIERFANWGAPLALLLILGWPRAFNREWFK